MRRRGPARLVALVLSGVALVVAGLAAPAGATPGARRQADRLEVVSQTPFVPGEGEFEVRLAWSGPLEGRTLGVRLFQLVGEEEQLDRLPSGVLNRIPAPGEPPIPLTDLPRDEAGDLIVRIPIRSLPLPAGDPSRIYLPDPGVYPVELEVVGPDGDEVATALTDLIRLPGETAEIDPVPLGVALRVGSGGVTVAEAVDLLERFPLVPVTVLVDPATLEEAAVLEPELLERFGAAVGAGDVAAVNPVRLDVSALAEIDHLELWDQVRADAVRRVGDLLDTDVRGDVVLVDDPPTVAATTHLAETGVRVLLGPVGGPEGTISTSAGPVRLLSGDEDLLRTIGDPASDSYDVLARLAVRFGEGDTTPVLLTAGPASGVSTADLAVVLSGLEQPGIITPAPLEAVADRASAPLFPAERPRQDLRPAVELLEDTLADLTHYRAFYMSGPLSPAYLRGRLTASLAVDVGPENRVERLAAIRDDLAAAFKEISLPEGRTVNLAATTSPLPLTLTNEADGARRVLIRFESDKLTFPEEEGDSRLVELEPGTSSFDFVVESRSLGLSPLDVVVATPDGSQELARTRITIRSTAVPGLGLLLSGAALVFLFAWWVAHATRRRTPPLTSDAPPEEAAEGAPTGSSSMEPVASEP